MTYKRAAWLAAIVSFGAATAQEPFAAVARRTFLDLLQTPAEAPSVSPTVHGQSREAGLVIEDLSWESLDGESVPAYAIRPAQADGPLPAIICLHGSSGSREAMVTAEFGPGEWVRHGRDEPHTRMLGWARELA